MHKMNKRYRKILIMMVVFVLVLSTGAMAAVQHATKYWNISAANQRSSTKTWTAGISSDNWYVRTSANTANVGAETTYYKVAISSSGRATSQVACNLGYLVQRNVSDSIEIGESNGTYAWRVDSTLNTEIVDGVTQIFSR